MHVWVHVCVFRLLCVIDAGQAENGWMLFAMSQVYYCKPSKNINVIGYLLATALLQATSGMSHCITKQQLVGFKRYMMSSVHGFKTCCCIDFPG